eukprot:gene3349-3575_t
MSFFVKVEYDIHDVITEVDKKKKKKVNFESRRSQLTMNSRPASAPAHVKSSQNRVNRGDKAEASTPIVSSPPVSEREVRANLQKRPTSAKRSNPLQSKHHPDAPWQFSSVGIDRDLSLFDQDLKISKFKITHPSPYDEVPEKRVEHSITPRECHHSKSEKSVQHRERLDSKTSGNIVNNTLPFHPHLKENTQYGIHNDRWNVMTALEDDPERLKPIIHVQSKSHNDFSNTFNSESLNRSRRSNTIEIFRADHI